MQNSMKICDRLWEDCLGEAYRSLHNPFVVALGLGTLPRESFKHYLEQDVHYLTYFAKAYALAAAKAVDVSDDHFQTLTQLIRGVHYELRRLHAVYAEWGINFTGQIEPCAGTKAYTNFLMSVAEDPQSGVALILTAMLPCSRLYGWIATELARAHPNCDHAYAGWIRAYTDKGYQELVTTKEAMLESLAEEVPYDQLLKLYRTAMELEVSFFSAQPLAPQPRQVRLLVVGPHASRESFSNQDSEARVTVNHATSPQEKDDTDLRILLEEFPGAFDESSSSRVDYNSPRLMSFVNRLSQLESASKKQWLTFELSTGATSSYPIDPKCQAMLRRAVARGVPVHVDSMSTAAAVEDNNHLHSESKVDPEKSGANSISSDSPTPDQGNSLRHLFKVHGMDRGSGVVYIGSDLSDLPALLEADFGIILHQNLQLQHVCMKLGIKVQPLAAAPLETSSFGDQLGPPVLYSASGWEELSAALLGGLEA